jgi:hypothetical protein
MSVLTRDEKQSAAKDEGAFGYLHSLGRGLFGDRLGLCLFLGALLFFGIYWTSAVRINDNFTLANALAAMVDGHFDIRTAVYQQTFYGPEDPFNTPGMKFQDGKLYGRNYGQLFLALPFALAFKGLFAVFDPRLTVVGLWCLCLLAFTALLGREYDRPTLGAVAGSAGALALFGINVGLAEELAATEAALLGLQLSTMIAAALVAVVMYRLATRLYGSRVGIATGLAVVFATPVAYWANVPKRHSLTAVFVVLAMYTLYRSRTAEDPHEAFRYRALSYAWVGLMTWVFPQEGPFLLLGIVVSDLTTARNTDVKKLVALGGVLIAAFIPFALSNWLVAGSPLLPPQFLPGYGPAVDTASESGHNASGLAGLLIVRLVNRLGEGLLYPVTDPEATFNTFVRSGYLEGVTNRSGGQAISLAMLESAPVLGALVALPFVVVRKLRSKKVIEWVNRPVAVLDVFVLVYSIGLLVIYLPSLPGQAQGTVRYLHPLYVLVLYILIRIHHIREIILERPRVIIWTFVASVLVGGQLLFVALFLLDPSLGEAIQAHALISLVTAGSLALWTLVTVGLGYSNRYGLTSGAVAFSLAAASTTVFVLLSRLYHVTSGEFLLPLVPVF